MKNNILRVQKYNFNFGELRLGNKSNSITIWRDEFYISGVGTFKFLTHKLILANERNYRLIIGEKGNLSQLDLEKVLKSVLVNNITSIEDVVERDLISINA